MQVTRNRCTFDVDPAGYERFWQWFEADWEPDTFRFAADGQRVVADELGTLAAVVERRHLVASDRPWSG